MTQQQIMDLLRQILQVFGTVATAFGFLSADAVAQWTATILQIAGPLAMIGGVVWGILDNRKSKLVADVDQMSGIAGVVTTKDQEGVALANSIPSNTVAPAGTNMAASVAK